MTLWGFLRPPIGFTEAVLPEVLVIHEPSRLDRVLPGLFSGGTDTHCPGDPHALPKGKVLAVLSQRLLIRQRDVPETGCGRSEHKRDEPLRGGILNRRRRTDRRQPELRMWPLIRRWD